MPTSRRPTSNTFVDSFEDFVDPLDEFVDSLLSTYENKKPKNKKSFISQREIHLIFKKEKHRDERKANKALKKSISKQRLTR